MDPYLTQPNPSAEEQEDEWDTDGFVIPSLSVGDSDLRNQDVPELADVKPPPKVIKEEDKTNLGPHGSPPSQVKQQQQLDLNTEGPKQLFKQKLKEADRRYSCVGHEDKVEHIRELVGSKVSNKVSTTMIPKTAPRDWLDPIAMSVKLRDTDGFVIPSLSAGDSDMRNQDVPELADVKPPPKVIKEEDKTNLGPHGAPPSQVKEEQQLDLNTEGRKQLFKQKLKEADRRYSCVGHEDKVEHIQELVGSKVSNKLSTTMIPKTARRDWLDPHCHECQIERYSH